MANRLVEYHYREYRAWPVLLDRARVWIEYRPGGRFRSTGNSRPSTAAKSAQCAYDLARAGRGSRAGALGSLPRILVRDAVEGAAGSTPIWSDGVGRSLSIHRLLRHGRPDQRLIRRRTRGADAGHMVLVPDRLRYRIGDDLSPESRIERRRLSARLPRVRCWDATEVTGERASRSCQSASSANGSTHDLGAALSAQRQALITRSLVIES
jgi:hypothetical protein